HLETGEEEIRNARRIAEHVQPGRNQAQVRDAIRARQPLLRLRTGDRRERAGQLGTLPGCSFRQRDRVRKLCEYAWLRGGTRRRGRVAVEERGEPGPGGAAMIDRGFPLRADLDERTPRPQQLDLLGLSRGNARFRGAQNDAQEGFQLVVDLLRRVRQEQIEVRGGGPPSEVGVARRAPKAALRSLLASRCSAAVWVDERARPGHGRARCDDSPEAQISKARWLRNAGGPANGAIARQGAGAARANT